MDLKKALSRIEELEKKLSVYERSPYFKTYITISNQIDSFNQQLTIRKEQKEGREIEVGKIDLFAEKDSKEFDRAWKYLNECIELNKKLDELRKLMTPEEKKKSQELRAGSVAEKYIFENK